jgi:ribonuclease HII
LKSPIDRKLWKQSRLLCGVDEAGRGSLAGPVVAAAVVLPVGCSLPGVDDSKLLTPRQRASLFPRILETAVSWGAGTVSSRRIDAVNIRVASFEAMLKALGGLTVLPELVIVDGFRIPGLELPQEGIIGGDGRSLNIAAASIIAKVTRDRMMERFAGRFPEYGFERHKGYGTPEHMAAIDRWGPCLIHRRTFAPVRQLRLDLP